MDRESLEMQLKSVGIELTSRHKVLISDKRINKRPHEKGMYRDEEPLLSLLEDCLHPGKSGGGVGGSSGYGTKPPVNMTALNLLAELDRYTRQYAGHDLLERIRRVCARDLSYGTDADVVETLGYLTSVAARIRQMTEGDKKKLNISCYHCGARYLADTEAQRELANVYRDGVVECLACGTATHLVDYRIMLGQSGAQ